MFIFAAALETDIGAALKALPKASAGFWDLGLNALLNNLAQTFLVVAVAVALFVLIFGGIKWATGGGDKEALGSAQKVITAAIIGLVIVFAAWAIIGLVKNFFGVGKGGGGSGGGAVAGCTAPAGKIGNDGGGGCCGNFTSQEGKSCDSGACRSWESCQIANGTCASGTSCCAKTGSGATCTYNTDCCGGICDSSTHKCNP